MTARAPWAWPEKAPSVLTGKAVQNNQQTHGWAPTAQTANRERAPRTAPKQWEFGPNGRERCCLGAGACSTHGDAEPKRGAHCRDKRGSPQVPPASAALLPACCSRGQGGQSLQKAQQLPKCLPRSSSASHTAGGLIPRLESNQSLTQGREGPFI